MRPHGLRTLRSPASLLGLTILNGASAADVGRAEELIVVVKIAILAVFVVAGLTMVEPGRLAPSEWASPLSIVGGGMLIFVAFEGFELIANSAEDAADPTRSLPRAFAISVGAVTALYVLVAIVTVGVLTLPQIRDASDFVLAEAARPRFGQVGFTVIGVAALLSTASAINATLYGATRLTYSVAKAGELPAPFARRLRGGLGEGLLVTSALTLVLANTIDLGQISTVGSAGFLIVFAAVNLAQLRLRRAEESPVLPTLGVIGCAVALVAPLAQAASDDTVAVVLLGVTVGGAFVVELGYRRWGRRQGATDTE